jgi:ferredoxin-thioredoxin reductase catalytic subunit
MTKKFWRCYVCNDIHWGTKTPDICPTCKVKAAYVEISAREARTILGHSSADTPDLDTQGFRKAIETFTQDNEFQLNPDADKVASLLDGVANNERNHGLKYCPCRLMTKEWEEDLKLVCPCNFPIHETYRGNPKGECWCSLFVKR